MADRQQDRRHPLAGGHAGRLEGRRQDRDRRARQHQRCRHHLAAKPQADSGDGYLSETTASADKRNATLAAVGKAVAEAVG
jgi:hypothetical protein